MIGATGSGNSTSYTLTDDKHIIVTYTTSKNAGGTT
jgi:hypothetical protein